MHTKRSRGRPAGSGIDDSRFLNEVADILLADPRMKPSSAMRRVIKTRRGIWIALSEDAMLRRLQDKWKTQKTLLSAAAQRRHQAAQSSLTFEEIIEVGVALQGAYQRLATPENLHKVGLFVTAVHEKIQEWAEPLARLQQHPMFRPENLQRLSEAAERMKDMERFSRHLALPRLPSPQSGKL